MSHEMTDTTNKYKNYDIPDGQYVFKVLDVQSMKGGVYYKWKLEYGGDEGKIGEQVLLPNMMGDLLKTLNCSEVEPNKYDWHTEEQIGKSFSATVSHKPDRKDPTRIRQHMSGYLPF